MLGVQLLGVKFLGVQLLGIQLLGVQSLKHTAIPALINFRLEHLGKTAGIFISCSVMSPSTMAEFSGKVPHLFRLRKIIRSRKQVTVVSVSSCGPG